MALYDPDVRTFVVPSQTEPNTTSTMTKSTIASTPTIPLGFRRVQWQAHQTNIPSIRAAERLGFQREGIVRMHGIARGGDEPGRQDDDGAGDSRSNWVGSIVWTDWEEGGVKERIDRLVAR
jgi:hypothetical protein